MFILIALATMTTLGNYPTQTKCETAIRQIYEQKINPYGYIDAKTVNKLLDIKMKWDAPKEYRCQRI